MNWPFSLVHKPPPCFRGPTASETGIKICSMLRR
jgi:hypothetical protein